MIKCLILPGCSNYNLSGLRTELKEHFRRYWICYQSRLYFFPSLNPGACQLFWSEGPWSQWIKDLSPICAVRNWGIQLSLLVRVSTEKKKLRVIISYQYRWISTLCHHVVFSPTSTVDSGQ